MRSKAVILVIITYNKILPVENLRSYPQVKSHNDPMIPQSYHVHNHLKNNIKKEL